MSASLVGSEMCIRDSRRATTCRESIRSYGFQKVRHVCTGRPVAFRCVSCSPLYSAIMTVVDR
eukprot:12437124-Alexandrium_andersonii.AAC.1